METDKLKSLLSEMDLPSGRISDLSLRNVAWLLRNMFIRNHKHPNFVETLKTLHDLHNELMPDPDKDPDE